MDIKYASLHQIDHQNDEITEKNVPAQGKDLNDYIERLLSEITKDISKRRFTFPNETTEVRAALQLFMEEDYEDSSRTIGNRLLRVEKDVQQNIALPVEIQRGSLFQTVLIDDEGNQKIIISKADHNEYLDTNDFVRHMGLPWKKHVYKALLIGYSNETKEIEEISVYDTNSAISKYWWYDFLELEEEYTDSHNTKKSLDLLDKKVFDPIKTKFPADHTVLRNAAIGYFRNQEEFRLPHFVDNIFRNYQPTDRQLPVDKLINITESLPTKGKFDIRFRISKGDIDKRASNKIHLNTNLYLLMGDHVPNIKNIVKSELDREGNKYIRIRSDEGYDRFLDSTE